MNTVRDLLNQSYLNIRADISQALISAINAAEERGEDIYPQLLSLITGIAEDRLGAFDQYQQSTNRNSVTHQFLRELFQEFVQPDNAALLVALSHRQPEIEPLVIQEPAPQAQPAPQAHPVEEDIYYFYE